MMPFLPQFISFSLKEKHFSLLQKQKGAKFKKQLIAGQWWMQGQIKQKMHLFLGTKLFYIVLRVIFLLKTWKFNFLTYLQNLVLFNNEVAASTCGISLILFFYLLEDLLTWHLKVVKEILKACLIYYNISSQRQMLKLSTKESELIYLKYSVNAK